MAYGQETGRRAVSWMFAVFLIVVAVILVWWFFPRETEEEPDVTGAAQGVERVEPMTTPSFDELLLRAAVPASLEGPASPRAQRPIAL